MSIRNTYPTIRPSLNLDFARSRTLDPRITFSRTTTGTYMDSDGLIKVASADVARFDHRYVNGQLESLGLLIEEQRSNLFNHTEDFTQLPVSGAQDGWVRGRVIPTTESVTAPDGSSGVSLLTENNTSFGEHYVTQTGFNYTSGVTYTWSWYVKPNGRDNVYCKVYTNFNNTQVILNLETSSEYYLTGTTFDNITNTKLPNGWYRVSFTSTAISTGAGSVLLGFAQSETVRSYTGDGSSGMYYWGAQVEAGAFPTSYIPNGTDSQATRNPDNVSMTGDNFSDWYNQSEGTIYISQKLKAVQDAIRNNLVYLINGGSGSDLFYNVKLGTTNIFVFGDDGTNYSRWQEDGDATDTKTIWAYDVSGDDFKPYWNGIEGVNESTTNTPSATSHTQLEIGATATDKYNGHISQLSYYPRRLSNSQLQNLTK